MATEEGKAAVRRAVQAAMARQGWNMVDLARESGVNIKTVSTFVNAQRWPSRATLARIEKAFGSKVMTPGTLAALGEEQPPRHGTLNTNLPEVRIGAATVDWAGGPAMSSGSEEALLVELTHRVQQLKHEIARLREPAEAMLALRARREQYLADHKDEEPFRSWETRLNDLMYRSEEAGLTLAEESEWSRLWDLVQLEMLRSEYGGDSNSGYPTTASGTPPKPVRQLHPGRKPIPRMQEEAARNEGKGQ